MNLGIFKLNPEFGLTGVDCPFGPSRCKNINITFKYVFLVIQNGELSELKFWKYHRVHECVNR